MRPRGRPQAGPGRARGRGKVGRLLHDVFGRRPRLGGSAPGVEGDMWAVNGWLDDRSLWGADRRRKNKNGWVRPTSVTGTNRMVRLVGPLTPTAFNPWRNDTRRNGSDVDPSGADRRSTDHAAAAAAGASTRRRSPATPSVRRPGAAERRAVVAGWKSFRLGTTSRAAVRIQRTSSFGPAPRAADGRAERRLFPARCGRPATGEWDRHARIEGGLRTLASGQRRALRDEIRRPFHEKIAGTFGVLVGTVKSRVSRARAG